MPSAARSEGPGEVAAREGIGLALERRDEQLVRLAAGVRAEKDDAVPLIDDAEAVLALLGEHLADEAAVRLGLEFPLLRDERRLLLEPDELGVAVGEARPGAGALVDEGVHVGEPGLAGRRRAGLPRRGDEPELAAGEVGERTHVSGRVDDNFLSTHRGTAGEEPLGTVALP